MSKFVGKRPLASSAGIPDAAVSPTLSTKPSLTDRLRIQLSHSSNPALTLTPRARTQIVHNDVHLPRNRVMLVPLQRIVKHTRQRKSRSHHRRPLSRTRKPLRLFSYRNLIRPRSHSARRRQIHELSRGTMNTPLRTLLLRIHTAQPATLRRRMRRLTVIAPTPVTVTGDRPMCRHTEIPSPTYTPPNFVAPQRFSRFCALVPPAPLFAELKRPA